MGFGVPPVIINRFVSTFKIFFNRFPFLWTGEKLNQLMTTIQHELSLCQNTINAVYNARYILGSTGIELDRWGEVLQCTRYQGETDNYYRERLLIAFRDFQQTLIIRVLKDAVTAVTGTEPECREHYPLIPRLAQYAAILPASRIPLFSWPAHLYSYEHLLFTSFVLGNHNWIQNGGFEIGDWGGDEEQSTEQVYKGIYSAKLIADGSQEVFSGKSNRINIDPATYKYTISTWVNLTSYTQGKFVLRAIFYDASDIELGYRDWCELIAVTTGWEKKFYKFEEPDFPVNTAKIDFQFAWLHVDVDMPIGTAYVDNYKFEIGDSATEDWSSSELSAMDESLRNVKLATLVVWLAENSGLGYYVLIKEVL